MGEIKLAVDVETYSMFEIFVLTISGSVKETKERLWIKQTPLFEEHNLRN